MEHISTIPLPSDIRLTYALKEEIRKSGVIYDDHIELRKRMHEKLNNARKDNLSRINFL